MLYIFRHINSMYERRIATFSRKAPKTLSKNIYNFACQWAVTMYFTLLILWRPTLNYRSNNLQCFFGLSCSIGFNSFRTFAEIDHFRWHTTSDASTRSRESTWTNFWRWAESATPRKSSGNNSGDRRVCCLLTLTIHRVHPLSSRQFLLPLSENPVI